MFARPFAWFPAVAAMAIVAAVPSYGQFHPPTSSARSLAIYSISGSVWDDTSQQRLENVKVDLKGASGAIISTTYSNATGDFEFADLANGEYYVDVALNDYDSARQEVVVDNAPRPGITVFLHRTPSAGATATTAPTVSVHQLAVPSKARAAFDKGITLLYAKMDYQRAINQFNNAIKNYPDYYEAYAQKGAALMLAGDKPGAEAAFRTSIAVSKNKYSEAMFLLAGFLNDDGKYADAEPLARSGLALDPASWRGHVELARTLIGLKQPDEAESNATQAVRLKPDQPSIYLILANIHIEKQNRVALLEDLNNYLKVAPNGPAADQARKERDRLEASLQSAPALPPAASQQ